MGSETDRGGVVSKGIEDSGDADEQEAEVRNVGILEEQGEESEDGQANDGMEEGQASRIVKKSRRKYACRKRKRQGEQAKGREAIHMGSMT